MCVAWNTAHPGAAEAEVGWLKGKESMVRSSVDFSLVPRSWCRGQARRFLNLGHHAAPPLWADLGLMPALPLLGTAWHCEGRMRLHSRTHPPSSFAGPDSSPHSSAEGPAFLFPTAHWFQPGPVEAVNVGHSCLLPCRKLRHPLMEPFVGPTCQGGGGDRGGCQATAPSPIPVVWSRAYIPSLLGLLPPFLLHTSAQGLPLLYNH